MSPGTLFISLALSLLWLTGCSHSVIVSADGAAPDTALARAENDKAFELIRKEKYADAIPLLQRAGKADPNFGPARNNLGLAYYHSGNWYDAAREFEAAVSLMRAAPDPINNLGLIHEIRGALPDAAAAYEKARKLAPSNPEYLANLCRVKFKQDPRDPALIPLLKDLAFRTPSPEWRSWAETNVLRLTARSAESPATALPATHPVPK